jgi:glycosyltransferase involved in cell wall biosynthesis
MKILYVIGSPDIGGTEKQLLGLIKEVQSTHKVTVAFLRGTGNLRNAFDETSADIIDLSLGALTSNLRTLTAFYKMRSLIKSKNFDIAHLFLPESVILGYFSFIGIRKNAKLIGGVRGSTWRRGRLTLYIYKFILRRMNLVICNSNELAGLCVNKYRVNSERVHVIPNGVEMHSIPKRNYNKLKAVYVANFHGYKGHITLIEAIKKLNFDIELRLVGNGSTKEDTKALVQKLGLQEKISFLGVVNPEESYIWANLMIHASQTEGLSNAILEGLSWGLPIIGFNVGGNSELIKSGRNGFLIEKYGAQQLADTLKEVELDKLKILGDESFKIGLLYTWEVLGNRHKCIYSALKKTID